MLKVLMASHSHPQISKGGAEISAFQLYRNMSALSGFEAWFLGADPRPDAQRPAGVTFSQPYSEREYLYLPGAYDWFKFANRDTSFPVTFRTLLCKLRPQVVHFHHYAAFGVEVFLHVREALPKCKVVLTLHEFLALCNHYGQMVTKPGYALCHEALPAACSMCFRDIPEADFFLRKLYIQRFFDLVDHFVAPSRFLAERYIDWGIPRERVSVIENVIPVARQARSTSGAPATALLRVGFFGQISSLKGINVLFEAAAILRERKSHNIVFEIHGEYRMQPSEFQSDFQARLAEAGSNVKFNGAYTENRVDALMQSVDLVLMPSIWWENSPVVIQEALRNRRLVVCSDIGGMAEKVRDGIEGFHFPVGNSTALASLLRHLAKRPAALKKLQAKMASPPSIKDTVNRHVELYMSLVNNIDDLE